MTTERREALTDAMTRLGVMELDAIECRSALDALLRHLRSTGEEAVAHAIECGLEEVGLRMPTWQAISDDLGPIVPKLYRIKTPEATE